MRAMSERAEDRAGRINRTVFDGYDLEPVAIHEIRAAEDAARKDERERVLRVARAAVVKFYAPQYATEDTVPECWTVAEEAIRGES